MLFDNKTFKKLPITFQMLIGFALLAFGAVTIVNAPELASGNQSMLLLFIAVGVLYLVNGAPAVLEGMARMLEAEKHA